MAISPSRPMFLLKRVGQIGGRIVTSEAERKRWSDTDDL
jgi:hypothetical protein